MQQRAIKAQAQLASSSDNGGASSSSAQQIPKAADVVELGNFLKRVKCVPTASDVEKLLTDEELLETANSLMRRAAALGLNVPKEAVKTMIERWLYAEKAYQVVKEAGLRQMKATLRMPHVHLNLRDAVPLAQPATAPLTSGPPALTTTITPRPPCNRATSTRCSGAWGRRAACQRAAAAERGCVSSRGERRLAALGGGGRCGRRLGFSGSVGVRRKRSTAALSSA